MVSGILAVSCTVTNPQQASSRQVTSHHNQTTNNNNNVYASSQSNAANAPSTPGGSGTSSSATAMSVSIPAGSSVSGIYVCTTYWQNSLDDKSWKSPYVDGVLERLYWNYFEPAPNKFDWSYLDQQFQKAIANNKKISLGIVAGNGAPDWLKTSGIPMLHFVEIPQQGKSNFVNKLDLPVVWNQQYLAYWNGFVAALGQHLKSNPQFWNTLTMIKVTGINEWNSDELRLPAERQVSNGSASSTDAVQIWKQAGYKPSLVNAAFRQIMDTFVKYFPDKTLAIPIISGGKGMPAIDDNGNDTQNSSDPVATPATTYLVPKLGRHFMIMYQALKESTGEGSICTEAINDSHKGASLGYQLCQICYKDPPCLKTGSPCDNAAFAKVLQNGIDHGGIYFELYPNDIAAYPDALKNAQAQIQQIMAKQN